MIDVTHPGVRATGASVLSLFQNLFGLALGPFIAGALSDAFGLDRALTVIPAFGRRSPALLFLVASRSYERGPFGAVRVDQRRANRRSGAGCCER